MSLTEEQKKLVKATAPVLQEHGRAIMTRFYAALFKSNPEYRNFFNQTNQQSGKQPDAFAATIFAFVQNLDNLDAMKPQMSRLSSKHRAVGVTPELYPTLGKVLVNAIVEALGDQNVAEATAAWTALYNAMSSIFIKQEKELYDQLGDGDKGFVPFIVTKKDVIAKGPTYSVTLARQDGGKVWKYVPGQYITVRVEKDGVLHQGHYIPTEPCNGTSFTIALKEGNNADQNTIVTNEIVRNRAVNSTVLVSAPAGSFGLVADAPSHLFIGGGIGIASLMSMINELNKQGKSSSVSVIQCVRSKDHAAFADQLSSTLPQGQYTVLTEDDPISKNHVKSKLQAGTHVYISGSEAFLAMAQYALAGSGVAKSNVHIKSIEPTLGLLKNICSK